MRLYLLVILLVHLGLALVGAFLVPVHWDEGWNLCVARTWIEDGHYGCKFDGKLTTPRLSTGVVAVSGNALGFLLFNDISFLYGRIPYLFALFLFLLTFFALGKRLLGRQVAILSLVVLLFLPDYRVSPTLLTVQSHSEIFLFLFISIGYLALYSGLIGRNILQKVIFFFIAITFFSLALKTKHQAEPFLLFALGSLPFVFLLMRDSSRALFAGTAALCIYFSRELSLFQLVPFHQADIVQAGSGTEGLAAALGVNLDFDIRKRVLFYVLDSYWFYLLGLLATPLLLKRELISLSSIATPNAMREERARFGVLISLALFIFSWTGWFLVLSIDFPRYFAPPSVFGSLFSGWGIYSLFQFARTKPYRKLATLLLTTLLALTFLVSVKYWNWYLFRAPTYMNDLKKIAEYLNSKKALHPRLETYETQVFHLLDIPYVYPPDQMNVTQIENHREGRPNKDQYNYLLHQPTYLLVGEWSREVFELYPEEALRDNLVLHYGDLRLYDLKLKMVDLQNRVDFPEKTRPVLD